MYYSSGLHALGFTALRFMSDMSTVLSPERLLCSEDGHLLVMATGEPENSILIWKWATGKVLVADTSSFPVHHITFNPWDGTQLVCIGESELNHVDFVEEELKLKADSLLYHVRFLL